MESTTPSQIQSNDELASSSFSNVLEAEFDRIFKRHEVTHSSNGHLFADPPTNGSSSTILLEQEAASQEPALTVNIDFKSLLEPENDTPLRSKTPLTFENLHGFFVSQSPLPSPGASWPTTVVPSAQSSPARRKILKSEEKENPSARQQTALADRQINTEIQFPAKRPQYLPSITVGHPPSAIILYPAAIIPPPAEKTQGMEDQQSYIEVQVSHPMEEVMSEVAAELGDEEVFAL